MPSLPIPLIVSIVLFCLWYRVWMEERRIGFLQSLLLLCAVQGVIIAMAQHYHLPWMRFLQPVTASLIPPLAWVTFQTTAIRQFGSVDWIHAGGPVLTFAMLVIAPAMLDVWIPLLFAGYGVLILKQSFKGPDALPKLRLQAAHLPAGVWRWIAISLLASALTDVLIVAAQMAGAGYLQPWLISGHAAVTLMLIGLLTLSGAIVPDGREDSVVTESEEPAAVFPEDKELMISLQQLMQDEKPYLDPDLSLQRLARKLGVPSKKLSAAVNRSTGENVSRFINQARIAEAQKALLAGQTVTNAMLTSGFSTKSNFNREFARITSMSPSGWLKSQTNIDNNPK